MLDDLLRAIAYRGHLFETLEETCARREAGPTSCDFVDWLGKGEEENKNLIELAPDRGADFDARQGRAEDQDAVQLSNHTRQRAGIPPRIPGRRAEEGILPHRESLIETASSRKNAA